MYDDGASIKSIQEAAGISRPAVYNVLKSAGVETYRREVLTLVCRFCEEAYDKPRSHVKGDNGGYCSPACFHADRSLSGEYSKVGGKLTRLYDSVNKAVDRQLGRLAVKAIKASGIVLKPGEVVHHKDGNRNNFVLDNLQIFPSQSAHMMFHHQQRGKRRMA
jgi:hypothetical protein